LEQTVEQLKLENQLCFPMYACARGIVKRYTPLFKPLGITYTQYIVLLVLWEEESISVGDLCRRLYLDSGTLTPLLKRMEEAGLLTRSRSSQDERVVIIRLTERGAAMRERAAEIPVQMGQCMPLTSEEAQTLYGLLYKILDGLSSKK
jgi:DNA-binding MarR family transcriptional regulator